MRLLSALLRRLFPPDCAECGGYMGRMHGNYWHADTCSHAQPPTYPDRWDDEVVL